MATAGHRTAHRLGGFLEASRREAVAWQMESKPEPAHIVVGSGEEAPWSSRSARWATAPEESEWSGARRAWVDDDGRFQLRVNEGDYEVDVGTQLASTSVTLLLIGLHVFVTMTESGELLRELRLNPEHDFRPE